MVERKKDMHFTEVDAIAKGHDIMSSTTTPYAATFQAFACETSSDPSRPGSHHHCQIRSSLSHRQPPPMPPLTRYRITSSLSGRWVRQERRWERRCRRSVRRDGHIWTEATEAAAGSGSRMDRDNDNPRRRWPSPLPTPSSWGGDSGRNDADGGQKGGRGDSESNKATTRWQGCKGNRLWRRMWQGQGQGGNRG